MLDRFRPPRDTVFKKNRYRVAKQGLDDCGCKGAEGDANINVMIYEEASILYEFNTN